MLRLHPILQVAEAAGTPAQGVDAQERSIIFLVGACILALIVVLLVLLQLAAIRRKPRRRLGEENDVPGAPESNIDPWSESGRRMDCNEDDQS